MNFDNSLTEQLSRLADEPGPASTVDLGRAAADARRARRARRAGWSAGVGGGVAVASAAALLVASQGFAGSAHGAAAVPTSPSTSPSPFSTSSPTGTDPLADVTTVAFGALPSGFVYSETDAGIGNGDAPYAVTAVDAATGQNAVLSTFQPGQRPSALHQKGGALATVLDAAPVNGNPAYWYSAPGSTLAEENGDVVLGWQIAPHQWVTLDVGGSDTSSAITPLVYRIAESARFTGVADIPLPVHVASDHLPVGWLSLTTRADGSWTFGLLLGDPDASGNVGGSLTVTVQSVEPGTSSTTRQPDGSQNPTSSATASNAVINGCKVTLDREKPHVGWLEAPDCDGVRIRLLANGSTFDALQTGGLATYFQTIVLLGPNLADWTTHVIG